jgi:hypothetical protein
VGIGEALEAYRSALVALNDHTGMRHFPDAEVEIELERCGVTPRSFGQRDVERFLARLLGDALPRTQKRKQVIDERRVAQSDLHGRSGSLRIVGAGAWARYPPAGLHGLPVGRGRCSFAQASTVRAEPGSCPI